MRKKGYFGINLMIQQSPSSLALMLLNLTLMRAPKIPDLDHHSKEMLTYMRYQLLISFKPTSMRLAYQTQLLKHQRNSLMLLPIPMTTLNLPNPSSSMLLRHLRLNSLPGISAESCQNPPQCPSTWHISLIVHPHPKQPTVCP